MLRNYFKIAINTLWRNKIFSTVNIIGLSVGIAAAFFIYNYILFESSYDNFHPNSERIYRISTDIQTNNELTNSDKTSAVIGPALMDEFPEIESYVRLSPHSILGRTETKKFQEDNTLFADSTIFSLFGIELIKGDKRTALSGNLKVVLTESNARKYFGDEDPIGKPMLLGGGEHHAIVTGVIKDLPENSHIKVKMFLSMATKEHFFRGIMQEPLATQWYTFVLLKKNINVEYFQNKISNFISKKYKKEFDNGKIKMSLVMEPLRDIYLKSQRKSSDSFKLAHGSLSNITIFGYIGIFILVIAYINFINLSTSRANERAKEVGIRKVTGATRAELIKQFLIESLLTSFIAGTLAIVIVLACTPIFTSLVDKVILRNTLVLRPELLIILFSSLAIGLLSGIYPAFVLSQFKPINVLKGKFSSGLKGVMIRKSLVLFQFTISISLIIATIVVYKQLNHMRNQDLGFKKDQMLVLDYHGEYAAWEMANQVRKLPGVKSCVLSGCIPGYHFYKNKFNTELESETGSYQSCMMNTYQIDYEFLKQYKIPIISGRGFNISHPTDSMEAIILNECAVRKMGWDTPEQAIGKKFRQFGNEGFIIGVTKDFHDESLKEAIEPLCYRLLNWNPGNFMTINLSSNDLPSTIDRIKTEWEGFIAHRPFEYFFLDETFERQYRSEEQFGKLFFVFSLLSIIISCLGLIGLVSYHTIQRTKEIGIRKILGATLSKIIYVLSKDYLLLVGISFILASAVSYYLMNEWLENFANKTNITFSVYLISGIAAAIVSLVSISYFTIKAALSNPIKSLRTE